LGKKGQDPGSSVRNRVFKEKGESRDRKKEAERGLGKKKKGGDKRSEKNRQRRSKHSRSFSQRTSSKKNDRGIGKSERNWGGIRKRG